MTFDEITKRAILPALKILGMPLTPEAHVMLLAIGLQESAFAVRRQMGNGPAASFWQFERGGGVRGVLRHKASRDGAIKLCSAAQVLPDEQHVWQAMLYDDVLGAGMARLLLLTDPKPLPALSDSDGAWAYYERNWRPGKPHPAKWPGYHAQAVAFVEG